MPAGALSLKIWPEADVWLERMEAYRPDRAENEVVRLDLAGSRFLRLLCALRVIHHGYRRAYPSTRHASSWNRDTARTGVAGAGSCESGEFGHLGNVWKEQIWLIDMQHLWLRSL